MVKTELTEKMQMIKLILKRLIGQIKIPKIEELKKDLPKMSTEIRDAIELLSRRSNALI